MLKSLGRQSNREEEGEEGADHQRDLADHQGQRPGRVEAKEGNPLGRVHCQVHHMPHLVRAVSAATGSALIRSTVCLVSPVALAISVVPLDPAASMSRTVPSAFRS